MQHPVPFPARLRSRRLTVAIMAAWGVAACAQTGPTVAPPPQLTRTVVPAVAAVSSTGEAAAPAGAPTGTPAPSTGTPAPSTGTSAPSAAPAAPSTATSADTSADPLGDLIGAQEGEPSVAPEAEVKAATAASPSADAAPADNPGATTLANVDPDFVGPPDELAPPPPPPPPLVLFPHRLGEFPAQPADAATTAQAGAGENAEATPSDKPPVLRSQLPADDPAGASVWRLGYSGRAVAADQPRNARACSGGGTPSTGVGGGLACTSTGEVKVRESLVDLSGGAQVQLVAQARGTDATSVNGRATAVDPYALLPQFYTAVSGFSSGGLKVLDDASIWAGRRDTNPFLMSSGLLPPSSPSLRFGVDNAKLGDFGLNYQYTARSDLNGANLPSYHTVRTAPVGTNDKGSVQVGFTRVEPLSAMENTGSAWWASAMHEQKDVLYGTNRLGLQYGQGSRLAMTGYTGMGTELSRVRVAESMEWKTPSGIGGSVESSLQLDRSAIGTLQWAATRVRPTYVANDQFRLTFEVAHDQISSGFGVGGQRTALTVAPTFTLGKSAGNTNLRAFYTYSRANDVDGITFAAPADAWASQASGSIFGVQLNRRW
ncbi:carbohydrate porin [Cupriavidus sp. H19C3]|uniref:carbohydrate porin n=1 Tax=Cupriavidus sp. H19C3 TaxID=3241603 RepID=UPI003BF8D1BE